MKNKRCLSDLEVMESGVVGSLDCLPSMHRRFLDVGLVIGTRVVCVGKSPLGDPKAFLIRGTKVAIRDRDAKGIILK